MRSIDINTGASINRKGFPQANIQSPKSSGPIGNTQGIPTVESTLTIRSPQSEVNPTGLTPQKAQQYQQGLTGILNATSAFGMDKRSFNIQSAPTTNPYQYL